MNGSLAAFATQPYRPTASSASTRRGFNPSPEAALALVFEIAAAALLVVSLAWDELRPPEDRAMPVDRGNGASEASDWVRSTQ